MSTKTKVVPHEADFQDLSKWQKHRSIVFWILLICSLAGPALDFIKMEYTSEILAIVNFATFILIPIFFILEIVIDRYYIAAEYTRRKGFIDNSLGSKFTGLESKGYFSNDEIVPGFYKSTVNAFENCFFTAKISDQIFKKAGTKNFIFFIFFMAIAYFGAEQNKFVVPLMQGLLSGYFLKEFIDLYFFKNRVYEILEHFKTFFNNLSEGKYSASKIPESIKLIMDYETNLAHGKYKGDGKIFDKLNPKLSKEWDELKEYYKISG